MNTTTSSLYKLFIGNIPHDVTSGEIEKEFSRFGEVKEVHLMSGTRSMSGQQSAFVKYFNMLACNLAIQENGKLRLREHDTQPVVIKFARRNDDPSGDYNGFVKLDRGVSRQPFPFPYYNDTVNNEVDNRVQPPDEFDSRRPKNFSPTGGVKIFAGGLPQYVDRDDLVPIFCPFGVVESVHLMQGKSKSGQQCAFITYAADENGDCAAAQRAIAELNGKYAFDGDNYLSVRLADSEVRVHRELGRFNHNSVQNSRFPGYGRVDYSDSQPYPHNSRAVQAPCPTIHLDYGHSNHSGLDNPGNFQASGPLHRMDRGSGTNLTQGVCSHPNQALSLANVSSATHQNGPHSNGDISHNCGGVHTSHNGGLRQVQELLSVPQNLQGISQPIGQSTTSRNYVGLQQHSQLRYMQNHRDFNRTPSDIFPQADGYGLGYQTNHGNPINHTHQGLHKEMTGSDRPDPHHQRYGSMCQVNNTSDQGSFSHMTRTRSNGIEGNSQLLDLAKISSPFRPDIGAGIPDHLPLLSFGRGSGGHPSRTGGGPSSSGMGNHFTSSNGGPRDDSISNVFSPIGQTLNQSYSSIQLPLLPNLTRLASTVPREPLHNNQSLSAFTGHSSAQNVTDNFGVTGYNSSYQLSNDSLTCESTNESKWLPNESDVTTKTESQE